MSSYYTALRKVLK
nr:unnamed protein product [Callosobruchus chinensis]